MNDSQTSSEQPPTNAPARLTGFIGRLSARGSERCVGDMDSLATIALPLAAAVLRDQPWCESSNRPAQIAVIGPTQAGKSTMVNLLLGKDVAEVSPLAGFTVHAQGFHLAFDRDECAWLEESFPDLERVSAEDLSRNKLATFACTFVPATAGADLFGGGTADLAPCTIWDTPDFDSLAAREYAPGLLNVAALADLFVLVVSKEKYSDLAVWRWLELLAPLGRPLLIIVNKLPHDSRVVVQSLKERLRTLGESWGPVPVETVPHELDIASGNWNATSGTADQLRSTIRGSLKATDDANRAAGVRALLRAHWEHWLAPVRAEHTALQTWEQLIQHEAAEFLDTYVRDYLEHPQRYDAFRRATLELLDLLEIPRVGGAISTVRNVVTWPARQLWSAGKSLLPVRRTGTAPHALGPEAGILLDAFDTLCTHLLRESARRGAAPNRTAPLWNAMAQHLEQTLDAMRQRFDEALTAHNADVQREVRQTADQLYRELQRHPTRLTMLRTARTSIDAGALLLAFKSGGLSALDAVWAPTAFALSSLLMEGAAGLEMRRAAHDLKQRQKAAVAAFAERQVIDPFRAIAADLRGAGIIGISPEELQRAEADLQEWEAAS